MASSQPLMIDGAMGEGGGQVLRSCLTLALCLGRPFRMVNIRAARSRPGLQRQHLAAVTAAAEVSGARVGGAELESRNLLFVPGAVQGGDYRFDIGTAGSTTLVLQTVLPALLRAEIRSDVIVVGGTHNPLAPPYEFLAQVFIPLLRRMGADVRITLQRRGFYPAGGGQIDARVTPVSELKPLHLPARGAIQELRAEAVVSRLPEHIARRELDMLRDKLALDDAALELRREQRAPGPGNVVMVIIRSEHITEVFTGFGERGLRAETVARRLVGQVQAYLDADVPVGRQLADQLLAPMALAGGGSFLTQTPSGHTTTNMEVIRRFMEIRIGCEQVAAKQWRIQIGA